MYLETVDAGVRRQIGYVIIIFLFNFGNGDVITRRFLFVRRCLIRIDFLVALNRIDELIARVFIHRLFYGGRIEDL